MALRQPPPELAQAIASASRRYQVPPDILTGIWRVESGSSFPNPYVNSSGYGGLFGTTNWNASTQAQADLAAKILAANIRSHGGDVSAALYAYSGQGYTSVPGQTTTGAQAPDHLDGSVYQTPPRPADNSQADTTASGGAPQPVGFFTWNWDWLTGAPRAAINTLEGPFKALKDVVTAFVWLANPLNWLRAFEALVGFAMLLFGLYFLGQPDGAETIDPVSLLTRPGKLASGAGAGAAKAATAASENSVASKTVKRAAKVVK